MPDPLPAPTNACRPAAAAGRLQPLSLLLVCLFLSLSAAVAAATPRADRYDIAYLWDRDLDNLLDYKEDLERLLGPEVAARLEVVSRGEEYGLIYDRNGSAVSSARLAVRHSEILGEAGLSAAAAVKDEGYHELYNVCYGLGPDLEALKRQYRTIYRYLGAEVGKNLFIEQTDRGNFVLVYRRRGDKESTATVARRHARLLRRKGLSASITHEENNEVVFGESSHLDDKESEPAAATAAVAAKPAPAGERQAAGPVVGAAMLISGEKKTPVAAGVADGGVSPLEKRLESYIKGLRRQGRIAGDERTGWLVIDLSRGETLVDINVDKPYQAASMIKPLVALAFFHRAKEGRLIYGPKSRRHMEAMIQRSSNTATNWVMRQLGGPRAVDALLKRHYPDLLQNTSIVEYIPRSGRTYRNRASAEDYGRFLVALWRKELPYSKEIRRLMALPGRDRLYTGTPIPRGCLVYNKTGSTAKLCGDMGILAPLARNGHRYPYVVVGIIEKQHKAGNYGRWKMARSNVIRRVSSMIYEELKNDYDLL